MPPVDTHHNPFDGWSRAISGPYTYAPHGAAPPAPPPSVFGALPYPTPPTSSSRTGPSSPPLTVFYLTALNPTVLNCAVLGPPGARMRYMVSTDGALPGYTVIKSAPAAADREQKMKSVALIEWQKHPRVEVRGAVPKQEVREWLRISRDQMYRTMSVRGAHYTWAPDGQYINLCSSGPTPQFLGRISRGDDCIAVELTADAIQLRLLDTIVVVAVLLQCGHNID
ncbi:hypothetical protein B0H11DRAFT_1843415 [Mycena galericulata]|nr:hypothetical protein B0H11DRAFT_1843415 [Mycena galericulata]